MDDFTLCCHIAVVTLLVVFTFVCGMAVGSNFDRCIEGGAKIEKKDNGIEARHHGKKFDYEVVRVE